MLNSLPHLLHLSHSTCIKTQSEVKLLATLIAVTQTYHTPKSLPDVLFISATVMPHKRINLNLLHSKWQKIYQTHWYHFCPPGRCPFPLSYQPRFPTIRCHSPLLRAAGANTLLCLKVDTTSNNIRLLGRWPSEDEMLRLPPATCDLWPVTCNLQASK